MNTLQEVHFPPSLNDERATHCEEFSDTKLCYAGGDPIKERVTRPMKRPTACALHRSALIQRRSKDADKSRIPKKVTFSTKQVEVITYPEECEPITSNRIDKDSRVSARTEVPGGRKRYLTGVDYRNITDAEAVAWVSAYCLHQDVIELEDELPDIVEKRRVRIILAWSDGEVAMFLTEDWCCALFGRTTKSLDQRKGDLDCNYKSFDVIANNLQSIDDESILHIVRCHETDAILQMAHASTDISHWIKQCEARKTAFAGGCTM